MKAGRLPLALAGTAALLAVAYLSSSRAAEPPGRFTVKITEPADGDFLFGKVKILAEVKSKATVPGLRVEFSVGGKLVFIDREPPYECFHDFGDQPRSWVIEARAVAPDGLAVVDTIVTRRLEIHYREEVDRVLITVSVTDEEGSFIAGLARDDFALTEEGVPQQILEFGAETRPITLGVLVDTSGSMKEEVGEVQMAAKDFVKNVRPEDRAFIVDFDENVFLLQDFTNDQRALQEAIEGTDAEGGTAFYDALYVSYWKMKPIEGRKAIAALTDGEDTNSAFSFKRIVEMTRTHDVIIYPIGLGATVMDVGIRSSLKQLADDTGGRAYFPRKAADLADVYRRIADDLRSQYFIAYRSTNRVLDGSWRTVKVECRRPDANIKARRGYYAVKR